MTDKPPPTTAEIAARYRELQKTDPFAAARLATEHPEVHAELAAERATAAAVVEGGPPKSEERQRYEALRESNPFAAARFAAEHPEVHAKGGA
jgi:hypothetical protein